MGIPSFRERRAHIPILQNHTHIRNQYPPCQAIRRDICFLYLPPNIRSFFSNRLVKCAKGCGKAASKTSERRG
uniref:Uncharacterized protein n=1 Tax=Siphoviridae sp. ctwHj1 TaxID=2825727 RepID=A0A8S5U647_9CAUD|nr:MAG TPA: hypothetical protein [Siphoviridae sp. ctwHj1]